MSTSSKTFKDVNRNQILYSLCTDACKFTGFPERAERIYNYIITGAAENGIKLSKIGLPVKAGKYLIANKLFQSEAPRKKR